MDSSAPRASTDRADRLSPCLAALAALAACAVVGWLQPPTPVVHDEFSHLLLGDTLAHGRLANPTHPMWEHLETMHVLQRPTYASKYQPGQGLALALGLWLADRAIVGVWLSLAFAAAVVTWMLGGWFGRPWPLVGGLLAALHPQIVFNWGSTFWGGALAMAGAGLVWGALPRLLRGPRARHGVVLGLGLCVLGWTRPLEGAIASVPVFFLLALRWWRRPPEWEGRRPWRGLVAPLAAVTVVFAACQLFYNHRVTGDALRLPYAEFHRQYEVVPYLAFQGLREEPVYRHPQLRRFYADTVVEWQATDGAGGLSESIRKAGSYGGFFPGWSLGVLFVLGLPLVLRSAMGRVAVAALLFAALPLLVGTFAFSHYAAPAAVLWIALQVAGLRALWGWNGGRTALRVVCGVLLAVAVVEHGLDAHRRARIRWTSPVMWRQHFTELLEERGGRHLVVVRHGARQSPHYEWVYNGADIDGASIVWAREMGPRRSARLRAHFADRTPWLYRPGRDPSILIPYPSRPGAHPRSGAPP